MLHNFHFRERYLSIISLMRSYCDGPSGKRLVDEFVELKQENHQERH